jgi:hypothetical protein
LRYDPPEPEQRTRPCACGHTAVYRGLRAKTILTAVGSADLLRPYFLCAHCQHGQFPADVELDVENTELSPGVRRMLAVVGHDAAFDHGREQMKWLAGLEVTTKAVERTAETIGADIAACQQAEIHRARQLDLPLPIGPPIPVLYLELGGTGVPMVRAETQARPGKIDGLPAHTREVKLGCVFTQTGYDQEGFAIRDPDSTTYTGAIKTAAYFQRNAQRMRYPEFRRQHLFVGSGVIEAGCKTVIGSRLKQSGMFWTVRGANAIIALSCCRLSGRFEDYWEARRAA